MSFATLTHLAMSDVIDTSQKFLGLADTPTCIVKKDFNNDLKLLLFSKYKSLMIRINQ